MGLTQGRVCIVGAGQAGGELALALRQQGCTSAITIVGEEPQPPYQRPPLSKGFLRGEIAVPGLYLRHGAVYEKAGIELVLNTRAQFIDRQAKTLQLAAGRELRYSKLALATGGRVRRISTPDAGQAERSANVHYLRTIEDAQQIRSCFEPGRRLVIIGGGFIGLEVASEAVKHGLKVTLLEALQRVLERATAPEVSSFYESVHRDTGVDLRTGVEMSGFEFDEPGVTVVGVRCKDGQTLPADLVVVGIGLLPNTELAQAAGLKVDNGVIVDEHARTSDPDIVAAGDCASRPEKCSGRRVRLESVPNAVEMARVAAATLAGKPRACDGVPWFWSDQYDLKLQMVGLSQGFEEIVVRGSMKRRAFAAFYLKAQRVIACDAVNRPQDFMAARRLIVAGTCMAPAKLADEKASLKVP